MTDEEIVESIIQIASSFGISCDNASYIIKSFENFGKEYMMSIEEDIERLNKLVTTKFNNDYSIDNIDKEAIEHLLSEREQDKARIKELEEENLHWRGSYHLLSRKINVIPKQKVKDVLDDIYDYFERLNVPDEDIEYIESKRKELLEEGE